MIQASDLKAGTTFELNGKPYKVYKYTHTKIGRGGANVKVRVRNLATGGLEEKTFGSGEKVEDITTVKKPMQFLYADGNSATFIDAKTYEQVEIPMSLIESEISYIKEGEDATVLFWGDKPISVEIPPKVKLVVSETPPGVKGDSATNMYKPAKLENDLQIKVPLFINPGDKIVVDTRTGEYVERDKTAR
jgi:elongation factor P